MNFIFAAVIGYFSGSIPYGLVLSRFAGLGDVRKIGSGNIGATNVLRTGNKPIAILTLLCDVLKGTGPVLWAGYLWGEQAAIVAGFAAMIGHIYPVWLNFKGGKGVATLIGVLFGLYWPLALIFLSIWLLIALVFKFSSLSALVSAALLPLWAWLLHQFNLIIPVLVLSILIWTMHRANIARLLNGTESKISLGSKK